jgi:hypothetical protein
MAKTLAANYESGVKGARAGKRLAPRRTVPGSQDPENGPESVIRRLKGRTTGDTMSAGASQSTSKYAYRGLGDARVANARLARNQHDTSVGRLRLLPAPHQQRCLLFTTDERRRRGA